MRVQVTKTAEKDIKKLSDPMRSRIIRAIENLPSGDVKKLQGYTNYYRLRVGNFRVIYASEQGTLIIVAVLPRGEAYKHF